MNSVERVKLLCKEQRIPISKLEKDLGYSNGYIGQLRKGTFPADRLKEISEYLNVSIEYLMTGEEPERLYLDTKDIDLIRRKIENLGYGVGIDFSRNYGYTMVVTRNGSSQSISFRNDEILKYLSCFCSSNFEAIRKIIEEKYASEQYYTHRTEEQLIVDEFNPPNYFDKTYQSTLLSRNPVDYMVKSTNEETGEEYYINIETAKMAQDIFENKELRVLFDAARDASPDDLQTVHSMLLALKRKEQGNID